MDIPPLLYMDDIGVKRLDDATCGRIRGGVRVSNFCGAVKAALMNSLNANADQISIVLDFDNFGFLVIDNGKIISFA